MTSGKVGYQHEKKSTKSATNSSRYYLLINWLQRQKTSSEPDSKQVSGLLSMRLRSKTNSRASQNMISRQWLAETATSKDRSSTEVSMQIRWTSRFHLHTIRVSVFVWHYREHCCCLCSSGKSNPVVIKLNEVVCWRVGTQIKTRPSTANSKESDRVRDNQMSQ